MPDDSLTLEPVFKRKVCGLAFYLIQSTRLGKALYKCIISENSAVELHTY